MKNKKYTILSTLISFLLVTIVLSSCKDTQSPGVEYMPDMYRSPAIEVYVDYEFPDSATAMQTPENSISRGYLPYPYPDSYEGFEAAGKNLSNPYEVNEQLIKEGQKLYASYCAHCHGKNGKGKGSIQNAIYGAVPSYSDQTPNRRGNRSMSELKAGHIYQAIMYGLNAMGPHSSLIREQDRWKIVAYVQTLQGNDKAKEDDTESAESGTDSEEMNDDATSSTENEKAASL